MRIVYHLGAHCTDEERLVRCLLKNRAALAEEGIAVPAPTRYRKLLRDTAAQLRGAMAREETQALVLEQIVEDERPQRMILSWESFLSFPQWALRGQLYSFGGERIRAFTQIFPQFEAEFHLSIRNPATFLPALFEKQKGKTHDEFMEGADPMSLRWSDVVHQIVAQNPNVPLTIWCDEDTPLIWNEILQAVSGHSAGLVLEETDELLSLLMSEDGLARMRAYLKTHPPLNLAQRRKVLSAFLEKFAHPDQLEMGFTMPGWDQAMVEDMTARYHADVALLKNMPSVRFISP